MPESATTAAPESALRQTLRHPLYRGATIAMFLSGFGYSAAAPLIAQFLVRELGASLPLAGMYHLTALTAPVAAFLIGARSDRTGGRLGLFRLCAVAGFLGWLGIALSTRIWMPFVISAVLLALSGGATSQVFAALRDELDRNPRAGNEGVVAIVRLALTAGWIFGPVTGAWLAASAGLRAMLVATAVATLAQIVPLGTMRLPPATPVAHDSSGDVARLGWHRMLPLLAFTGLYICVYAGEATKYAYLPIYMNEQLRLAPALSGAVIGIQPLVEVLIMPFSVVLARRVGLMRIMALSAILGVLANLCFALTGSVVGLFAGQILMGGVWGIFAVLGIIAAQRLLPGAVATASAIFLSAPPVSLAIGGLAGGLGVAAVGLPHVFFVPAVFAVVATAGLFVMARRTQLDEPARA